MGIFRIEEYLGQTRLTNELVGVAFDGFPIYVSTTNDGSIKTPNKTLDGCNGMMRGGSYEYRVTSDFPYLLGCYRGEVYYNTNAGTHCYFACRAEEV